MAKHDFNFEDLLEDEPRAAFFARSAGFGARSPARRQFAQSQFSSVYNRFLGALGKQLENNEFPDFKFQDFLSQPENSLSRMFFNTPRSQRPGGQVLGKLAPPTRFFI